MWVFPQPVKADVQPNQIVFPKISPKTQTPVRADDGRGILRPEQVIQPSNDQPIQKPPVKKIAEKPIAKKFEKQKPNAGVPEANGDIQAAMKNKVIAKWGESYWAAMLYLLDHESGSDPHAVNPKSGACGIPQAYPCSKLLNVIGSLDNVDGQLDWMVNYIAKRYGDPVEAEAFHKANNYY